MIVTVTKMLTNATLTRLYPLSTALRLMSALMCAFCHSSYKFDKDYTMWLVGLVTVLCGVFLVDFLKLLLRFLMPCHPS